MPGLTIITHLTYCFLLQYTFILAASKQVPKQVTDFDTGKAKSRKTVGIRLPDSEICQAILGDLDRPLLCSSAYAETEDTFNLPEAAVIADAYAGKGIDFIVDAGHQVGFSTSQPHAKAALTQKHKSFFCSPDITVEDLQVNGSENRDYPPSNLLATSLVVRSIPVEIGVQSMSIPKQCHGMLFCKQNSASSAFGT